ncbi:hypothetical protein [Amycolatopsis sp. CA-230715]|uniref:hypothetical protein n=1 Tax=Amycolatopsis sp. CA-230715 TaxID=2745196 RepID=UPI001C0220F6|nr:hypothetical protein [Amycolatopsis sp. CA-230715]QWF82587.1 hypothetical protein HUW46_06025 [Amycolatopsis sp. CA-230715]
MRKGERVLTVLTVCGGLLAAAPAAQAAPVIATAAASLGSADVMVGSQQVQAAPIAVCEVDKMPQSASNGTAVGTTTKYGRGDTTCSRDANGTATAKASGQRFETSILKQFGGPVIKVRSYTAGCATTANGSSGSMEISGVTGVTVPTEIPANYTIAIPGKNAGDPPMAEVVVNELIAPTPPDGSLGTHAMHIKLFPRGGPASGDIMVGSANCDPYGG